MTNTFTKATLVGLAVGLTTVASGVMVSNLVATGPVEQGPVQGRVYFPQAKNMSSIPYESTCYGRENSETFTCYVTFHPDSTSGREQEVEYVFRGNGTVNVSTDEDVYGEEMNWKPGNDTVTVYASHGSMEFTNTNETFKF